MKLKGGSKRLYRILCKNPDVVVKIIKSGAYSRAFIIFERPRREARVKLRHAFKVFEYCKRFNPVLVNQFKVVKGSWIH